MYKSVIKGGKIKFYIYSHSNDVTVSGCSKTKGIPTCFIISMSVIVKNLGANPVTIKDISWDTQSNTGLNSKITFAPRFSDTNNYLLLSPYEQECGVLQIEFVAEGYGQGNTNEYKKLVDSLSETVMNEKFKILLKYKKHGRRKIKSCSTNIDITKIIHEQY